MNSRCLLLMLPASLLGAACTYGEPDHHVAREVEYVPDDSPDIVAATIDTGATLADIWPGEETGAYVDYAEEQGEGSWGVYVSCDAEISGYSCLWDIYATPHADQVAYEPDLLEYEDAIGWYDPTTVVMASDTAADLDGFILYTDPGVTVRFDVFLDGESGQRYVYWVGDGAVHAGAPSNPIDLTPAP
jgi:hypothetical protein